MNKRVQICNWNLTADDETLLPLQLCSFCLNKHSNNSVWDLNLGSKEFSLGVSVVRGFSESKKKWCEPVSKDLNVPTALIKYLRAAVMVEVHTMD